MSIFRPIAAAVVLGLYSLHGFTSDADPSADDPSSRYSYNWQKGELLPLEGLSNPLNLHPKDLVLYNRAGRFHALNYPVEITGALIPYEPIENSLNRRSTNSFVSLIEKIFQGLLPFENFDDFLAWMGLHTYPQEEGSGPYFIPFSSDPDPEHPSSQQSLPDRMGLSLLENSSGDKFLTFSCAACHASNLFGRKILGLQNRFPRANRLYVLGDKALRSIPTPIFQLTTGANQSEAREYRRTRKNMKFVESKNPSALGLDTSLAHTALSLSHRSQDPYAKKRALRSAFPRHDPLRKLPSESKPGTWWNVKYKNKWLLDGSVVSGNPIYTNILWNEIGRGTDLHELESWLDENQQTIDELTAAVYNSEPPHITDFFPAERIDLDSARRGQKIYRQLDCQKCHGEYHKNWEKKFYQTVSEANSHQSALADRLKTFHVEYFEDTPIEDMGTDPARYEAMASLLQLNNLQISKNKGIKIQQQKGYVPPPLVGIWARWPYLHNNSIPNLCALFTPPKNRPITYWSGEAIDKDRDFDFDCNGYPLGDKTPEAWKKKKAHLYDTRRPGLSNQGHSRAFTDKNGQSLLSDEDRQDLIRFLQTL